jgi:uroporphyrinogen-III synthase
VAPGYPVGTAEILRVVLTREHGRNDEFIAWLPEGAETFEVPLTETRYIDAEVVERELRDAASEAFATLVVTSSRSAAYVQMALSHCSGDVEIFSVGPSTTRSLCDLGLNVCAQSTGGALDLAHQIRFAPVMMLGATSMRTELADELRSRSLEVAVVSCYETRPLELDLEARALLASADVVVIGAPSAWNVAAAHVAASTWVVVPGLSTARSVEVAHPRVLVGWGPAWRERLATLDGLAEGPSTTEQ